MVPIYSKASKSACHVPNWWALLLWDHHKYNDSTSNIHKNKKIKLEEQRVPLPIPLKKNIQLQWLHTLQERELTPIQNAT